MNHVFLMSYPRSGRHLTRGLVESLTGRPTSGTELPGKGKLVASVFRTRAPEFGVDPDADPVVFYCHWVWNWQQARASRTASALVYVVRNPHEALESHARSWSAPVRFVRRLVAWDREQIDLHVETFAKWPGPKVMLYYEDLVSGDEQAVIALGRFLGVDEERIRRTIADRDGIDAATMGRLSRKAVSAASETHYWDARGERARPVSLSPATVDALKSRYGPQLRARTPFRLRRPVLRAGWVVAMRILWRWPSLRTLMRKVMEG